MAYSSYTNPFDALENQSVYYDQEREDNLDSGIVAGGVESGLHGLKSSFNNALAAGGRAIGADSFAQGREQAADIYAQRAAGAGHMLQDFGEADSASDYAKWGLGVSAQNLPLLGSLIASGAVGGAAGARLMGRKGLAEGMARASRENALANMVEQAMKGAAPGVKRTALEAELRQNAAIQKQLGEVEAQALQAAQERSPLRNAIGEALRGNTTGAKYGSFAGSALPYFGATTGETYGTLRNDPDAEGSLASMGRAALASGAAQASLGMMFEPARVMRRVAKSASPMALAAGSVLGEGVTEAGEQLIQQFTHNQYNPDAGYDGQELLEAGLAGAVVGGTYSLPTAALGSMSEALNKRSQRGPEAEVSEREARFAHFQDTGELQQHVLATEALDDVGFQLGVRTPALQELAARAVKENDPMGAAVTLKAAKQQLEYLAERDVPASSGPALSLLATIKSLESFAGSEEQQANDVTPRPEGWVDENYDIGTEIAFRDQQLEEAQAQDNAQQNYQQQGSTPQGVNNVVAAARQRGTTDASTEIPMPMPGESGTEEAGTLSPQGSLVSRETASGTEEPVRGIPTSSIDTGDVDTTVKQRVRTEEAPLRPGEERVVDDLELKTRDMPRNARANEQPEMGLEGSSDGTAYEGQNIEAEGANIVVGEDGPIAPSGEPEVPRMTLPISRGTDAMFRARRVVPRDSANPDQEAAVVLRRANNVENTLKIPENLDALAQGHQSIVYNGRVLDEDGPIVDAILGVETAKQKVTALEQDAAALQEEIANDPTKSAYNTFKIEKITEQIEALKPETQDVPAAKLFDLARESRPRLPTGSLVEQSSLIDSLNLTDEDLTTDTDIVDQITSLKEEQRILKEYASVIEAEGIDAALALEQELELQREFNPELTQLSIQEQVAEAMQAVPSATQEAAASLAAKLEGLQALRAKRRNQAITTEIVASNNPEAADKLKIVNKETGAELVIPSTLEELISAPNIMYRGEKISGGQIKLAMAEAKADGKPLKLKDLMTVAQNAYEFRYTSRPRAVLSADESGNETFTEEYVDLRINPTIDQFGITPVKLKGGDFGTLVRSAVSRYSHDVEANVQESTISTESEAASAALVNRLAKMGIAAKYNNTNVFVEGNVRPITTTQDKRAKLEDTLFNELGVKAEVKGREKRYLIGKMDNQLFFATKDQRKEFMRRFTDEANMAGDLNMLERNGTIIKKESGQSVDVDWSHITNTHGDVERNGKKLMTHDGVIAIANGTTLAQGVALRKMYPNKNKPLAEIEPQVREFWDSSKTTLPATQAQGREHVPFDELNDAQKDMARMLYVEDTWMYDTVKGIARSPIRKYEHEIDAEGNVQYRPTDVVEGESINNHLEFGRTLDLNQNVGTWTFNRMFPTTKEQPSEANLQQFAFGAYDPYGLMEDDTTQLEGSLIEHMMNKEDAEKVQFGMPASMALDPGRLTKKLLSVKAATSRAYAMSVDDILLPQYKHTELNTGPITQERYAEIDAEFEKMRGKKYNPGLDDVMLMPSTFTELNKQWREIKGRDLTIGDTILLHRDPALPDSSSMSPFVFQGIARLENSEGSHDRGIVVHTLSDGFNEMAGDFDGDSAVAIVPTDKLMPRPIKKQFRNRKAIGFLKKDVLGSAIKDPIQDVATSVVEEIKRELPHGHSAAIEGGPSFLDQEIVTYDEEHKPTQRMDLLNTVSSRRASGFSQQIGTIVSKAQYLAEMGALDDEFMIELIDPTTGTPSSLERIPFSEFIAALGQGSISAKKKAAWAQQGLDQLQALEQTVNDNYKPRKRDLRTGEVIRRYDKKTKKEYEIPGTFLIASAKKAKGLPMPQSEAAKQARKEAAERGQAFQITDEGHEARNKPVDKQQAWQKHVVEARRELAVHRRNMVTKLGKEFKSLTGQNRIMAVLALKDVRDHLVSEHNVAPDSLKTASSIARYLNDNPTKTLPSPLMRKLESIPGVYDKKVLRSAIAYRTVALNQLVEELKLFGEPKVSEAQQSGAREAAILNGIDPDRHINVIEGWKNAMADARQAMEALDSREDENEFKVAQRRVTEINNEIKAGLKAGKISVYELLAHGFRNAFSYASVDELKQVHALASEVKIDEELRLSMRPTDSSGKPVAQRDVPAGRYILEGGVLRLVEAYDPASPVTDVRLQVIAEDANEREKNDRLHNLSLVSSTVNEEMGIFSDYNEHEVSVSIDGRNARGGSVLVTAGNPNVFEDRYKAKEYKALQQRAEGLREQTYVDNGFEIPYDVASELDNYYNSDPDNMEPKTVSFVRAIENRGGRKAAWFEKLNVGSNGAPLGEAYFASKTRKKPGSTDPAIKGNFFVKATHVKKLRPVEGEPNRVAITAQFLGRNQDEANANAAKLNSVSVDLAADLEQKQQVLRDMLKDRKWDRESLTAERRAARDAFLNGPEPQNPNHKEVWLAHKEWKAANQAYNASQAGVQSVVQAAQSIPRNARSSEQPSDPSPAQLAAWEKARERGAKWDVVDETQDSLLAAIAKLGGLDLDEYRSEFEGNEHVTGFQIFRVFNKPGGTAAKPRGRKIGDMAEELYQRGYLKGEYGVDDLDNQLLDLIHDNLAGDTTYSSGLSDAALDRMYSSAEQDRYENQDYDDTLALEEQPLVAPNNEVAALEAIDMDAALLAQVQDSAESMALLMGIDSPVRVLSASQMYHLLTTRGTAAEREEAEKLLHHGKRTVLGKRGGSRGLHYNGPNGEHFIYISGAMDPQEQAVTLSHELGHAVIDSEFMKLYNDNPELYQDIVRDFREATGKSQDNTKDKVTTHRKFKKEGGIHGIMDKMKFPNKDDAHEYAHKLIKETEDMGQLAMFGFDQLERMARMEDPETVDLMANERDEAIGKMDDLTYSSTDIDQLKSFLEDYKKFNKWLADPKNGRFVEASKRKAAQPISDAQAQQAERRIQELESQGQRATPEIEWTGEFHEWLADEIGMWMGTDKAPETAGQTWLKSVAEKLKVFLKEQGLNFARLFGMEFPPPRLTSVDAWMKGLVRSEKDLNRMFGKPQFEGQSLAARLRQKQIRLKNWARNPNNPDIWALNEVAADIEVNLDKYIPKKEADMLRVAATAPAMKKRIYQLIGKDTVAAERIAIDPTGNTSVAYLYALTTMQVLVPGGPAGPIQQMFRSLTNSLRDANRMILEATPEEADQIIAALNKFGGERKGDPQATMGALIPPDSEAARLYAARNQRYARGVMGKAQQALMGYNNVAGQFLNVPYQLILQTGNPELIALAKRIQPKAWELFGLKRAGYIERQRVQYQRFAHQAAAAIQNLDEQQRSDLKQLLYPLQRGKTPQFSNEVHVAHKKLRDLLNYMYNYADQSGLEIKKRGDYWPFLPNHEYIRNNINAVVEAYTSHDAWFADWQDMSNEASGWAGVRNQYIGWIKENQDTGSYNSVDEAVGTIERMSPQEFVRFYLENDDRHMLPGWRLEQLEAGKNSTPGFRFANPRILDFLLTSESKSTHEQVLSTLHTDLSHVLQSYVRNTSKRVEYQHLLSQLGEDGFQGVWERARATGATDNDIRLAVKYIDTIHGQLGLKERDYLDKIIKSRGPDSMFAGLQSEGGIMNPKINNAMSWALAFSDIVHLTLTAFTSLVDPLGALVRTDGNYATFMRGFQDMRQNQKRELQKLSPTARQRFIDLIGAHNTAFTNEDLMATYFGAETPPAVQRFLSWYFKVIGVEAISNFTSDLSQRVGYLYVLDLNERALAGDQEALAEMHRLNVTPEDIKLDENKEMIVLDWDQMVAADPEENERDLRVRTAVMRFVEESQIRPNAATRSFWLSNPYYRIPGQWRGFMSSFDDQIMRPAYARMIENGDMKPIAAMAMTFVPVMLIAETLRDQVRDLGDGDDDDLLEFTTPSWKKDWTLFDHVAYAVEKSGFYGRHEIVGDIAKPLFEGDARKAAAEAGGVLASDMNKLAQYGKVPLPAGDLIKW